MSANIAEAYSKHKNLKLAAEELGMKWQTLYVQLRKAGVPVTGDKAKYGNDRDKLAAKSEAEFQRLVPLATNQNFLKFQAKCDFMVGKERVDVKASRLHLGSKRYKARRWSFSVKRQELLADFMVCFAYQEVGYRLLLIPGEIMRGMHSINVPEHGVSKWFQYEVTPDELSDFFKSLA